MDLYDPNIHPSASDWLELDEGEQAEAVSAYHRQESTQVPNLQMHAMIHVVVENQLAEGISVAGQALERLMAEGLDRHDAVHAIGSVLGTHLRNLMQQETAGTQPHERYFQDLQALTKSNWDKTLV
jgi:hypothetical protein